MSASSEPVASESDRPATSTSRRNVNMPLCIVAFVALSALGYVLVSTVYRSHVAAIHSLVSVGMPRADVVARLGEPDRVSYPGQPLDPPHVSGFVPSATNENVVYTYHWRGNFVYVFINKDDDVSVYYVCQP